MQLQKKWTTSVLDLIQLSLAVEDELTHPFHLGHLGHLGLRILAHQKAFIYTRIELHLAVCSLKGLWSFFAIFKDFFLILLERIIVFFLSNKV